MDTNDAPSERVAAIIEQYLPDFPIKGKGVGHLIALRLLEAFGENIHEDILGFVEYMQDRDDGQNVIATTLAHDAGGALAIHEKVPGAKWMVPRVDGYRDRK